MKLTRDNVDVFFVLQLSTPLRAAPAQRLYKFCELLAKEGYRVCVVGGVNAGELISSKLGISRELHIIRVKQAAHTETSEVNAPLYLMMRFPLISTLVNMFLAFFQATYIVIKRPKIVVVSVPPSDLVLATFFASRLLRSVYIVDMRDPSEEILLHKFSASIFGRKIAHIVRRVNYAVYKKADMVVFTTDESREMLSRHGIHGVVIPNGADLKIFKPSRRESDTNTLTLVFSGTATDYYDPRTLIVSLKALNELGLDAVLFLVGSINRDLENFIVKMEAGDFVKYLGFYPPSDLVTKVFSRCDVGTIPRIDDPAYDYAIPAKFYEYIASGMPVLALCKKESALADFITRYDVGWVCEWSDVKHIAETIRKICLNKKLIEEKRENALKLRPQIDRNKHARLFLMLLKVLLKRSHTQ